MNVELRGGPADGKEVEPKWGGMIVIPVMRAEHGGRVITRDGAQQIEMLGIPSPFDYHQYSPSGAYLGIQPPRNFPTPFPTVEPFPRWARLAAWFAHVRRLRLRLVDPDDIRSEDW